MSSSGDCSMDLFIRVIDWSAPFSILSPSPSDVAVLTAFYFNTHLQTSKKDSCDVVLIRLLLSGLKIQRLLKEWGSGWVGGLFCCGFAPTDKISCRAADHPWRWLSDDKARHHLSDLVLMDQLIHAAYAYTRSEISVSLLCLSFSSYSASII